MITQFKNTAKALIHLGHCGTAILDKIYSDQNARMNRPPVFILGPPRSGTTILYQSLIHSYQFSYITNLANRFYMCPVFANLLALRFFGRYRSSFDSRYGFEKGLSSPSESGNIWNRWFPQEKRDGYNYTPEGFLKPESQKQVVNIMSNLENRDKTPLLIKNGKSGVRLQVLKDIFPKALFIRIHRNPVDIASSILVKRRRSNQDWWSVMPKEIDKIRDRGEFEEVVLQVYYIEKNLDTDLRLFPEGNTLSLHYRDLCGNPGQQLEKIGQFLQAKGYPLQRSANPLPGSLKYAEAVGNQHIRQKEIEHIRQLTENIFQNDR
ncbi:MAG: sulfotransferase family protein [Calditrichia bacterium]